jgi:hypothetical protein
MPMSVKYNKEGDFELVKETLFSSKNKDQLISAVKYINNFNKKYKITENSPEFVYFEKMVKLMRKKLRYKKPEVDNGLDEDSSMGFKLKNINIESLLEFNVLHEGVDDFKWIQDSESSFKPKFPFNGKEQWVDVSQLNLDERKKLVDYIIGVLPNREDWEGNGLGDIRRGDRKGIIIHCGSDRTDYEPEENLLCFADKNYEEDYNLPELDINNSIYIDGTEVIEYINMIDGGDLEESLDWDSKDTPFGEKDKNFDNDPTWIGDDEWETNPERSYWKQGNSGVGSNGSDVNESQDLDWIRDVSDRLPTYDQRTRVNLKDFLLDYAEDNLSVVDFIHNEDLYVPTEEYETRYTPEEWDEYGLDRWRDGDFKEHGQWVEDPWVTSSEIIEELESDCNKWEFIDRTTNDYDLERGSYDDLFIFKRKKDRRYFALGVSGDSHDGINDNNGFLYEVFPQMKLVYESRKKLIKKILKESDFDWVKEIEPTPNYKGHPQGVVVVKTHQEIDELCDIIDEYNGEVIDDMRNYLHDALEYRRNDLERMSLEDGDDYGGAVLSVSFFVVRERPGKISLGYWDLDISEDISLVDEWLEMGGEEFFSDNYQIYKNLNQVKEIFKNYKNPELD